MNFGILDSRALVLSALALLLAFLLRKKSAALRHAVLAAATFGLLVLPVLRSTLPLRVVNPDGVPNFVQLPARVVDAPFVVARGNGPIRSEGGQLVVPKTTPLILRTIGRVVCGLLLIRLLVQLGGLSMLAKKSRPVALPGHDRYSVRLAEDLRIPCTCWIGRAVIFLPSEAEYWDQERLRSVLFHEGAHIERGDWFLQLAGRLMCAFNWANPLAWLIQWQMTKLAEQAADDAVLRAGLEPSSYAQTLLTTAKELTRHAPGLSVPMARRAQLSRRISAILDGRIPRGAVRLGGIVAGGLLSVSAAVPAASLVLGLPRIYGNPPPASPQSIYSDINKGLTTPGMKSNGFVGVLSDGRKVEFVEISRFKANGEVETWQPDGTPLEKGHYKLGERKGSGMLFLYFRLHSPAKADLNAGIGSGPSEPGDPEAMEFAGGGATRFGSSDGWDVLSLFGIPKVGRSGQASVTFTTSDGPQRPSYTYDVGTGTSKHFDDFVRNPQVDIDAVANVFVTDAKGNGVKVNGKFETRSVQSIKITYFEPDLGTQAEDKSGVVFGITEGGRHVEPVFSTGYDNQRTAYFAQSDHVKTIEIDAQRFYPVEFKRFRLRPDPSKAIGGRR